MQPNMYRYLWVIGLAGTLGLSVPHTTFAQQQASDKGRQMLQEQLLPGWTPGAYRNLLNDLGYQVTSVDDRGRNFVEYHVAKGQQRYIIQMNINPNSDRVNDIDVIRASQQQTAQRSQQTRQQQQNQTAQQQDQTAQRSQSKMQQQRQARQQDADDQTSRTVPIVEEQVEIGKRQVQRGGVRVQTGVEETPVERSVKLREEKVNVYRRPANRPVNDIDEAFDREVYVIPEIAEVPVVRKEPRVVGEVVIDKDVAQRQRKVQAEQRRTTVDVEEIEPGQMRQQQMQQRRQSQGGQQQQPQQQQEAADSVSGEESQSANRQMSQRQQNQRQMSSTAQ